MTHRINPFLYDSQNWTFSKYDSVRWIFFQIWLKELNFLTRMSQRIECFFFFLKIDISQRTDFSMTQRIEFFRCKELNLFCLTQRIEPFLQKWRKELSPFFQWIWRKELNLLLMRRKELNLFLICLKELSFFLNMTQRIELFFPSIWLKEFNLFFWIGPKGLNLFIEYDSKNWTFFFFEYDSKNHFWKRLKDCF